MNNEEMTVLFKAISSKKSKDIVKELINSNSNIINEIYGFDKRTALIEAIKNDYDEDIIKELINNGADVNQCDNRGRSPLSYAMSFDNTSKIGPILINAGADIFKCDNSRRNIFMYSYCRNCDEINCKNKGTIQYLLKNGCNVKDTDEQLNNVIHLCCCRYLIDLALKNGVLIDSCNKDGITALTKAILVHDDFKVKWLLSFGADPNCQNNYFKRTPLHLIVECTDLYNFKIVTLLIYYGANLFIKNRRDESPINILFDELSPFWEIRFFDSTMCAFVRHILLFHENFQYLEHNESISIKKFVEECKIELISMKNKFITNDLTFYEFCLKKQYYQKHIANIQFYDYKYSFENIKNLFPIYHDLIILMIKTNHTEVFNKVLRRNLCNILIRPYSFWERYTDLVLDYDCLDLISRYLDRKEIYNLFLASIDG